MSNASRWLGGAVATVLLAGLTAAGTASAADQFTIDSRPDSFGAIVTDKAGNGYLAWEHAGSGGVADQPMFCRLAPAARRCTQPVKLTLPGAGTGDEADANQLFPILGPGNTVWVVTSRYVLNDTLVWTSTDGGRVFGGAYEIPYRPECFFVLCEPSVSYAGLTDIDDALPVTPAYATYDGQTYKTAAGQPSVGWLESSNNPGLGFNLDDTAETAGGPAGASEFTFDNPGGGGVGGSALGTTSSGEVVEAYWLDTTPPKLAYYSFGAHNPDPISPQDGWTGPTVVGDGYVPRLADGDAGLFMVSSDSVHTASEPTAVDLRKYSTATHTFGPPHQLAVEPRGVGSLFRGGGLAENFDTGELAAVWPTFSPNADTMRLYLSSDAGAKFSSAQNVATVQSGYADFDNARVAIADHGSGFVTFEDERGLEVADLAPLADEYEKLHHTAKVVRVAVTCPAPTGHCRVTVELSRSHFGKLAGGTFPVPAGVTRTLSLRLDAAAVALLAHHTQLSARLEVTVKAPSLSTETTTATVKVGR